MRSWLLRDFDSSDLDQAVRVWTASPGAAPLFGIAEVIEALMAGAPAVVAVADTRLIGMCAARVTGERAWVLRIAIDADWRGVGVGSALLGALEEIGRAHV